MAQTIILAVTEEMKSRLEGGGFIGNGPQSVGTHAAVHSPPTNPNGRDLQCSGGDTGLGYNGFNLLSYINKLHDPSRRIQAWPQPPEL